MTTGTTTIRNIEQADRLLAELKYNIMEIETAEVHRLLELQDLIQDRYGFPRYCLNVRTSVKIYFINKYADTIYRIIINANQGIPLKEILKIIPASLGEKKNV